MLQTAKTLKDKEGTPHEQFSYQPLADMGAVMDTMVPEKTSMDNYTLIFN